MALFWDVAACSSTIMTDVAEELTVSVVWTMIPWGWRHKYPLKRRPVCTLIHGATSHKAATFIIVAVRT
jgi:hypothetical protein